ncbi:MAG: transcription antitermination factor NusB [Eubacteriales bacterium]|nr:transcription antitermination factor NusB [Eubacteriales bacterium]
MSRRTAREVAMKVAFARLLGGEETYESILDQSGIEEAPTEEDMQYADAVVNGVNEHLADLDAKIEECAVGWKLTRMPRVDICILHIAVYEMLYREDIPESVSINEAVELAKRFGGEKSPSYINGVLGTLSKSAKQETV